MRKSLLLLVALSPLAALAGLALPAGAASGNGSSLNQPAAGALDLDKIPTKPVTGRQAVRGIAIDDESDDMPALGKSRGDGLRAAINGDHDGLAGEGLGERDD